MKEEGQSRIKKEVTVAVEKQIEVQTEAMVEVKQEITERDTTNDEKGFMKEVFERFAARICAER